MRKLILTYSTPKAWSKFALRGLEFCGIKFLLRNDTAQNLALRILEFQI